MRIQIKETGEMKNLTIKDDNNIDWTADLITAGSMDHNDDGNPIMTQADFDWWSEYINDSYKTETEVEELVEKLEDSGIECPLEDGWNTYVNAKIAENAGNDYDCHRRDAVEAMNEIRNDFLK